MRTPVQFAVLSLLLAQAPSLAAQMVDSLLPRFATTWGCPADSIVTHRAARQGPVSDDVGRAVRTACDALVMLGRPTDVAVIPDRPIRAIWTYAAHGATPAKLLLTRRSDATWVVTRFENVAVRLF